MNITLTKSKYNKKAYIYGDADNRSVIKKHVTITISPENSTLYVAYTEGELYLESKYRVPSCTNWSEWEKKMFAEVIGREIYDVADTHEMTLHGTEVFQRAIDMLNTESRKFDSCINSIAREYFQIEEPEYDSDESYAGVHYIQRVRTYRDPKSDTDDSFAVRATYREETVTTDSYGQDLGAWNDGINYEETVILFINKDTYELEKAVS